MKYAVFISFFALLKLPVTPASQDASWELEKDKNRIKVWTRETAGSKYRSFKAKTVVNVPAKRLFAVMSDVDSYPEWMPDVIEAGILKTQTDSDLYYYFEMKSPWPASNRDNVIHAIFNALPENGGFELNVIGVPGYLPEKEGVVRIPNSTGKLRFIPIDERHTKVIFTYSGDPGGSLPAWIINWFLVDIPYATLANLREQSAKGKYR